MKQGFDLASLRSNPIKDPYLPQISLNRSIEGILSSYGIEEDQMQNVLDDLQNVIDKNFGNETVIKSDGEQLNIKALIGLKENVATKKILDIGDIEVLFGQNEKNIKSNYETISKALRLSYREIYDSDRSEKEKKAQLKMLKVILDSLEYYASGQTIRTTTGPLTGYSIGTAQTSGTARMEKPVVDAFNNMSEANHKGDTKEGIRNKFLEFSNFLSAIKKNNYEFEGTLSNKFSKFVGLEVMHNYLFKTQEAGNQGTQFEAFLAAFSGGIQVGGARGAADFMIGGVEGSAKVVNTMKFSQSTSNLEAGVPNKSFKDIIYLIGIKSVKTKSGIKRTMKEGERIRYLDIHMVTTRSVNSNGNYSFYAYPSFVELDDPSFSVTEEVDNYNLEENSNIIGGTSVKTSTQFDLSEKNFAEKTFVTTLDFSFIAHKEFEDTTSQIMKNISEEVEKAYSAMADLKNNVTLWIVNKDLVAANSTVEDEKRLSDALQNMRTDSQSETEMSKLSENKQKSKKDLDNLIKEVILKRLLK
jgi:hypothetical protein